MINKLFTGRFRPQTLDEIILLDRIRKEIGNGELNQNYMLISNNPGTGKCVTGDTIIEVFDERTNDIMKITIDDFRKLCLSPEK